MARGASRAISELKSEPTGLPKSFESVLNPDDFFYDRADDRTYRAFNSTKQEFEAMIDSRPMKVIEEKSFTKTAKVKGEEVKIERIFNRTVNQLDSQNGSGYGVRETYILTKGGKQTWWYYYGTSV